MVVYTLVFGFGAFFMLRMMAKSPEPHETGPEHDQPTRAAGITQAQVMGSDKTPKREERLA